MVMAIEADDCRVGSGSCPESTRIAVVMRTDHISGETVGVGCGRLGCTRRRDKSDQA